jgi:hypothetical protein
VKKLRLQGCIVPRRILAKDIVRVLTCARPRLKSAISRSGGSQFVTTKRVAVTVHVPDMDTKSTPDSSSGPA